MKAGSKVQYANRPLTGRIEEIGTKGQFKGWAKVYVLTPHRVRGMIEWQPLSALKPL